MSHEIAEVFSHSAAEIRARLPELELACLKLPQVECPTVHHFGPGICIREVSVPAGTFPIGHRQKHRHQNVMLKGRVLLLREDGSVLDCVAPMMFIGEPGRKVGYVIEDMVWWNVYPTEPMGLKTADQVEDYYIEKSEGFELEYDDLFAVRAARYQTDREDYAAMLTQFGLSDETLRAQFSRTEDQCDMPEGTYRFMVERSPIEGKGIMATAPIEAGETIGPVRVAGLRTPLGRYVNHSASPNAVMLWQPDGGIDLVATRLIAGKQGGMPGDEIVINYRDLVAMKRS